MEDLSIAQEYLVCAVNEKGKLSGFSTERMVCMVAAGLLELQMEGCVSIEDNRIVVIGELPASMGYLKSMYDLIDQPKPLTLDKLLNAYNYSFSGKALTELTVAIGDSLEQLGVVTCEMGGLLKSTKCYLPKKGVVDHIIDKVRSELLENGEITDEVIALVVLLEKSRCLKTYFSDYERREIKNRLKEIVNSDEGKLVKRMVEYIETMTAVIIAATTAH